MNMEGIPEDMWSPNKHLYKVILKSLRDTNGSSIMELDVCLKKFKQSFSTLLQNPPKNERSRSQLKSGMTEGVSFSGHNCPMHLSKDLVDESIIISDMFDLDEYLSTELLCTAQRQLPHHPGLTRGLVAILLYYDGRKAIAYSLRDLFQATSGRSWISDISTEFANLISSFTHSLVEDYDILNRILDILQVMDIKKETEKLRKNRAFGSKKHQHQILELFEEIRLALATALFNWSAQKGLPKNIVARLIQYFTNIKNIENENSGDVVTTVLMAYLYSIDTSSTLCQDNSALQKLPILNECGFMQNLFEAITSNKDWETCSGLHNFLKFSFGLTLASLRQIPHNLQNSISSIIDRDEHLIDSSLSFNVLDYILFNILEKDIIYKFPFFYRRIHIILTDFIVYMHSKITELRGKADETARAILCFLKEGLEPPANLDHNFEKLMLCIGKFYKGNRAGLSLCLDYWGSQDVLNNSISFRSVSLFKFIRLAGELLPQTLFVPYLNMIAGLSSCEESARQTFNLLKQATGLCGSATLSWEHFFNSLMRYYSNLRQEHIPGSDTIYKSRIISRGISPQEIEGLCAVLSIIQAVAFYDEIARVALCEHPTWAPIHTLIGLLTCSVPIILKAQIANTLSAFAKTRSTAIQLWNTLEASQIISANSSKIYHLCNLQMEIEQIESRNETFPLTQSVLEMLYTLVETIIPKNLGAGIRKTGFDPYLTFIVNGVFLNFYNRNYRDSSEKWSVGEKCLRILHYLLKIYEPKPEDFIQDGQNSAPGFHIMLQLHTKSEFLRHILFIIDKAVMKIEEYNNFPGKKGLEDCALHGLNIIESALSKQNSFFEAHSVSSSCHLLTGLNKLLLDVNPRSNRPDYLLITTKFIMYSSYLPHHALTSVNILSLASCLPIINSRILVTFTQSRQIQSEIRHGFVECLECEVFSSNGEGSEEEKMLYIDVEFQIKEQIILLIQNCLSQPAPNIAHFLLGFDIAKDSTLNQMQKLTTIDSSNNCTKSLVRILDDHLEATKIEQSSYEPKTERIIERAYSLLYDLCSNQKTSDAILRYLRSCGDFLCRHVLALPFTNSYQSYVLNQMSYVLKCTAIELKQTAQNSQSSRFQNLCELLVGYAGKTSHNSASMELNHYIKGSTNNISTCFNTRPATARTQMLLCHLIDCLKLQFESKSPPALDFFQSSLLEQIIKECETKIDGGRKLINIKKLHDTLNYEMSTVQSSIAGAQRKLILHEIELVLSYALIINENRSKGFACIKLLEAWGQVTEMLFAVASDLAIPVVSRQELISEILQKILRTVVHNQPVFEFAFLFSGTTLLLLVNLKYCNFLKPLQNADMTKFDNGSKINALQLVNGNLHSNITSNSHALSLKFILRNILEWIIMSEGSSQKLRTNLYAALLNCMCIIKGNQLMQLDEKKHDMFLPSIENCVRTESENNHIRMCIEVLKSFGDKLFDIICHDSIVGHDVCKMLALAYIETLLDFETSTNLISYIVNHGYLSHIIESLSKSDDSLCEVLRDSPENLKPLYVYESKMAVLLRISSIHLGAELLLEAKILEVLSVMHVFDMHPDVQDNNIFRKHKSNEFIPTTNMRYRQILIPTLNLCESIISTLGPKNQSAICQVQHFLISHSDAIEIILRYGKPFMELGNLHELSEVTGLISRTVTQVLFNSLDRNINKEASVAFHRFQHLMLTLFSRFIINEQTFSEMFKPENVLYEPTEQNRHLHIKYFLEIASNLSLYCRNATLKHCAEERLTGTPYSPILAEKLRWSEQRNECIEITQMLGDILNQLKGSVEFYNTQKLLTDNLLRQRSLLTNVSIDAKAQATFVELTHRLKSFENQLFHCSFITEQCLYLLWSQLNFYITGEISNNPVKFSCDALMSIDLTNRSKDLLSTEDMCILKKDLMSIFNETFKKQLLQTLALHASSDSCFAEALLRRIKSLIQFSSKN